MGCVHHKQPKTEKGLHSETLHKPTTEPALPINIQQAPSTITLTHDPPVQSQAVVKTQAPVGETERKKAILGMYQIDK